MGETGAAMYKGIIVFALLLAIAVVIATAQQPAHPSSAFAPHGTPTELGLAGYAKFSVLRSSCLAVTPPRRSATAAFS